MYIYLVLSSHIPDCEPNVPVLYCLHVKTCSMKKTKATNHQHPCELMNFIHNLKFSYYYLKIKSVCGQFHLKKFNFPICVVSKFKLKLLILLMIVFGSRRFPIVFYLLQVPIWLVIIKNTTQAPFKKKKNSN